MRKITIFRTGSQRGVNTFMSGEGAIEHPMSTHSAPFGTSWNTRGWRYIASILMILTLCVGNAWAAKYPTGAPDNQSTINWKNYSISKTDYPISGESYYLLWDTSYTSSGNSYYTKHFLKLPVNTPPNVGSGKTVTTANWRYEFLTINPQDAKLFTFVKAPDTQDSDHKYNIYCMVGETANYMTDQWGKSSGTPDTKWNTTGTTSRVFEYQVNANSHPRTAIKSIGTSKFLSAQSSSGLREGGLNGNLSAFTGAYPLWLIPEEAFEDATAGKTDCGHSYEGAQYYWQASAAVYTNGSASTDGGTAVIAKQTYQKRTATAQQQADYGNSIEKSQKGAYGSAAVVNIFCKVARFNDTYTFDGFTAFVDNVETALNESESVAANTYYEVDAENHIYRVSFAANGTDESPTVFTLRANFAQAADPVANVYDTNDTPTGYITIGEAIAALQNGYRLELLSDIENLTSTITINKNITLDFNGKKIKSANTGAPTNLIEITTGDVTFVDNSLDTPGGVTTTGATAVLVSGGSLTISDGKYKASTYAVERTGGSVTIKNGGFESDAIQDINGEDFTLNGGFYYNSGALDVPSDYAVSSDIPTGMKYTTADYRYMVVKKTSENYPVCVVISKNENGDVVSRKNFNTLAKAIAYANNNEKDNLDKTLLLREDYTLPAGNYTIPQYTTLVVPYAASQTDAMPNIRLVATNNVPSSAYRTLTLASGAHIDVLGAIEVGGLMTGGRIDAAGENGISRPGGDTYGLMQMNSGSSITFYEDANLYAWGFVQGEGTIDMRRGAIAREQFQMYDWKGFMPTATMAAGGSVDYTYHVLPINQYHIQNIEVKTTYRPGSKLYGQVGAYIPSLSTAIGFNDIGIIGVKYSDAAKNANPNLEDDVAIFLMDNEDDSEDTWVRKSYDVDNDVQLYEANNSAYLGSLVMEIDLEANNISIGNPFNNNEPIDGLDVDSRDFALPITNNFKIHLLSGTLVVTQNTELLPGAVIEVDKNSTMTIEDHVWKVISGVNTWIESPQTLYLYDKDQWGTYVFVNKVEDTYNFGYASRVRFRPGGVKKVNDQYVRDISSPESLGDAKLIVHGTVDVKGYLKTTQGDKTASPVFSQTLIPNTDPARYIYKVTRSIQTSTLDTPTEGGASIISTIDDAGTINLLRHSGTNSSASVNNYIWQIGAIGNVNKDEPDYYGDHVIAALLKNADGSYTDTKNQHAGQSYCFIDFNGVGTWKNLTTDGCFVYEVVENETVYYAKPREYVALANGKTENADHTYSSADGTKTLILMDDCQWWEVKPVAGHPDLFHCTHPQNNVYYYYDYEQSKWREKRYTVTWNDWDGTQFGDPYILKYGVQPKYLGNIPQRAADAYYTYNFIGWSPAITESTIVTGDVTYTAQYERKDVMYSVTWKDLADNIIETGYYKLGDVPACTEEVNMANKEWTPAVSAVTGNTIYKLQAKKVKANYTITWKNWDGTTLQTTTPAAGTAAAEVLAGYTEGTPSKPALDDIEFEFAGWTPTVVDANADAVYTATFNEQPITYAITWKNYDGTTLLVQDVTPNTVPQYTGATPVHASEGYSFIGWSPAVVAATENAEYVAQFELQNKTVDGVTYTIPASTQQSLTTITIKNDGKVEIPASSSLTVYDLILEATSSASGQLDAPANSNITTVNAYFDWKPNGETGTASRTWYAIAVPWEVNAETGIFLKETGRHLVIGQDFDLIYYDGSERASVGNKPSCWKYVQKQSDKIMHPGQLYMMYFDPGFKTIRFAKKAGSAVLYTGTVSVSEFGASDEKDANWNGIANPKTYYASLSLSAGSATYAQVLNNGSLDDYFGNSANPVYRTINLGGSSFSVGKPLFVQATQATPVVVTKQTTAGIVNVNAAPRRAAAAELPKGIDAVYRLAIAGEDQPEADNLFVQVAEDEKADRYTIGQDLVKGGVASGRAQVWVNRYDAKLSVNTQALSEDEATYPLTIQVPANGDYVLSVGANENEDYALYLTRDGEAIWNLSDGDYVGSFEKGAHTNYGLRVSAKSPQIATGLDEAVVDAKGETRKVMINDKVFIIRGENVYSVDGQLVK